MKYIILLLTFFSCFFYLYFNRPVEPAFQVIKVGQQVEILLEGYKGCIGIVEEKVGAIWYVVHVNCFGKYTLTRFRLDQLK